MSKTFKGGMDSLLGGFQEEKKEIVKPQETPVTVQVDLPKITNPPVVVPNKKISPIPQESKNEGIRATFILSENSLEKIRAISYWERILIKDIVNEALEAYIAKYEKEKGKVKPMK